MLGWISSLFNLIASAVNWLFELVDKAVHMVVTVYTLVGYFLNMASDLLTPSDAWAAALFAPVLLFIAIFVTVAIIRLIVSMGGH